MSSQFDFQALWNRYTGRAKIYTPIFWGLMAWFIVLSASYITHLAYYDTPPWFSISSKIANLANSNGAFLMFWNWIVDTKSTDDLGTLARLNPWYVFVFVALIIVSVLGGMNNAKIRWLRSLYEKRVEGEIAGTIRL